MCGKVYWSRDTDVLPRKLGKEDKSVDRIFGMIDKIVGSKLSGEYISTGWKLPRNYLLSHSVPE